MFPNILYAKSAFDEGQLKRKLEIGCDGIEYQLLSHDFTSDRKVPLDQIEKSRLLELCPASVIHPPLDMAAPFTLLSDDDNIVMKETMRLAQKSAEFSGKRCSVVVHVGKSLEDTASSELATMSRKLEILFSRFPDVDIVLENLSIIQENNGRVPFRLCSAYYDANVQFARYFSSRFGKNPDGGWRVGTCLDVCHAVLSGWYLDALMEVLKRGEDISRGAGKYSLADYMEANAPYIGLVHLAGAEGNGYGLGHGTPFVLGEQGHEREGRGLDILEEFLLRYNELGMSCPVTLEVGENDYLKASSYSRTLEALRWMSDYLSE